MTTSVHHPRIGPRRSLYLLLSALLLGAVTNLGFTWACALRGSYGAFEQVALMHGKPGMWALSTVRTHTCRGAGLYMKAAAAEDLPDPATFGAALIDADIPALPEWTQRLDPKITYTWYLAWGWPRVCLAYGAEGSGETPGAMTPWGTLGVQAPNAQHPLDGRVPVVPIWPGLIFNTAAMSTAWLLVMIAPACVRGVFRLRRARCLKCGYDLRGSPSDQPRCPECGWVVGEKP